MANLALITGAARRIGRAIAIHLAVKGWDVAIHYNHSEEPALALRDELAGKNPGGRFACFAADLAEADQVQRLIPQVIEAMGPIGLCINNASVFEPSWLRDTDTALFHRQMRVNFEAPFLLIRDFARLCRQGLIVNLVDTRITSNKSNFAAYSLSKKALWELTRMAALELGPAVRVNAIAPGLTLPPEEQGEEYLWHLAESIPMKRPGGLEPVLKSLDYVLENEYLTGQLLFCDGGENLGTNTN